MKKLKGYNKCDVRPWKKYAVYRAGYYYDSFVSETVAKSPEQAVNNVRWKFGKKGEYNEDFVAKEIEEEGGNYAE